MGENTSDPNKVVRVKQTQTHPTLPAQTFQNLVEFAEEEGFLTDTTGEPNPSAAAAACIKLVLKLHKSPEMPTLKDIEGGSTLSRIETSYCVYANRVKKTGRREA